MANWPDKVVAIPAYRITKFVARIFKNVARQKLKPRLEKKSQFVAAS
jgi:hypothetical protein